MTAADLIERLRAEGATLATAESCTGGLLAAALTDVAGASDVFGWGVVTYANAAKTDLVGVAPATLEAHGAVSEEVAREMAEGALARSGATLAVAITGIAGPGRTGTKPEGRVCFATAGADGTRSETAEFGALGRGAVRAASVAQALRLVAGRLA
ncbi:MAG: CinA family protein [Hasllibacter sp.]